MKSCTIFTHLIVIITVTTIGVCSGAPKNGNGNNWRRVQGSSMRRTRANERSSYFDLELLEVLGRSFQNKNMILSPISIKVLLGSLMEGAGGETRNEISHALRLYDDPEATRLAVRSWVSLFKANNTRTELKLATHMFLSHEIDINEAYAKILRKHYMGDVSNIDVTRAAESAEKVNDWVGRVTNGFIPRLVNEYQITEETRAILASAVYFKSKWSKAFESTITKCFYKIPGHCTDTIFMQKTDLLNYAYVSSLDAEVIEIPYKDARYSMVVMVPKGRVQELTRDLQHGYLTDMLSTLTPTEIRIQLPRFTADSEQDVIPALKHLQVTELFGSNSNLSGIFANNNELLSISNILHSAKIIVDEDGTEAAGATAAQFVPLIGKLTTPFIVDKPFVFLIKDSVTNVILFAGQIFEPEKAENNEENDGVHEVGDKSSIVDYINALDNNMQTINAVNKEHASENEHKGNRKPGRPEPLPTQYGRPNGFLPIQPQLATINFEGPSDKGGLHKKVASRVTQPPPLLEPTASLHSLRPTPPPPLIEPTTAPPLIAQSPSTPAKGSSNTPSIIRSFQLSDTSYKDVVYGPFVHKQISIRHYKVLDPPKIRRSPDERIVFAI